MRTTDLDSINENARICFTARPRVIYIGKFMGRVNPRLLDGIYIKGCIMLHEMTREQKPAH